MKDRRPPSGVQVSVPGRLHPAFPGDVKAQPVRMAGATRSSRATRLVSRPPGGLSVWLVLVPAVTLLLRGWQRRWLADDGLIHLRVAEQVLRGHGLVFNAGERVEASTSPLWVAVLALARMTRLLGLETAAVLIGLVSTTTGVLLAACGARLGGRREGTSARARVLPGGATFLAVLPPMWDFATSGLETGFLFLWLGS